MDYFDPESMPMEQFPMYEGGDYEEMELMQQYMREMMEQRQHKMPPAERMPLSTVYEQCIYPTLFESSVFLNQIFLYFGCCILLKFTIILRKNLKRFAL